MKINEYLRAEHADLRTLSALLQSLPPALPEKRAYALDELRRYLLGHLQAEHLTFQAALEQVTGEALPDLELVKEADNAIGAALELLAATDPTLPSWDEQLHALLAHFDTHCAIIESAAFTADLARLDDATGTELVGQMQKLKPERIRAVESDGMPTDQDHLLLRLKAASGSASS